MVYDLSGGNSMKQWKSKCSTEHLVDEGCFKFRIWIPDDMVPYDSMKSHLLSSGNPRLAIVEYLKEHIEKEAIWSRCPDWEMDYGVILDKSHNTTPSGGNDGTQT
jgi:hypothetical protein